MSFSSGLTGMAGGFQMSLIALGTVFIVIAFLAIMIRVLHKVCYRPQLTEVAESRTEFEYAVEDAELVAVIAAAIIQYTNNSVKIISFRPSAVCSPKKSVWRNFGRIQNFERNI